MFPSFEIPGKDFDLLLQDLEHKAEGMEKATKVSFDVTMAQLRARTEREFVTHLAVRNSRLLRAIGVSETKINTRLQVAGVLKIDDTRSLPLKAFSAKQTPEGVEVQVTRFGTNTLVYKHAFGPLIPKLGGNIFIRVSKMRFPLEKIKDLVVTQVPGAADAFKRATKDAEALMRANIRKATDEAFR